MTDCETCIWTDECVNIGEFDDGECLELEVKNARIKKHDKQC